MLCSDEITKFSAKFKTLELRFSTLEGQLERISRALELLTKKQPDTDGIAVQVVTHLASRLIAPPPTSNGPREDLTLPEPSSGTIATMRRKRMD